MDNKWKKSLMGYAPESVNERINGLNQEFDKSIKTLENDFISLENDVGELKGKIIMLKKELNDQKVYEEAIAKILLKGHMEVSINVYQELEKIEKLEKDKLELVAYHESEHTRVKKTIKTLVDEMQTKVDEYRFKMEASRYEGANDINGNKVLGVK